MAEATKATDDNDQALRRELAQLRDDLAKITDTLQSMARARGADARQHVEDQIDAVSQKIAQQPLTASLAAFGIGVVLGLLFGRRP